VLQVRRLGADERGRHLARLVAVEAERLHDEEHYLELGFEAKTAQGNLATNPTIITAHS
jgi:hypothetical protein